MPECVEQNDRINNWKGGETQALRLFEHRLKVEEMVGFKPNLMYFTIKSIV
jgi:hypothetical protein